MQDFGAVWILFLNADGSVKADAKISAIEGNFAHTFIRRDFFGTSLANPGDLDEDGVTDLAVGVPGDDNGLSSDQSDVGAAWILYLNRDGTVKDTLKISGVSGGFQGTLRNGNRFGSSMANLGDINQDGVADIAIGAPDDDDGGTNSDSDLGAVWILFLNKEPGITIQNPSSEPPQTAFEDYRVLVRVSDNDPDSSLNVDVSFRRAGDDKFLTADMDQEPSSQNSFAFDIPGVFVDSRGLEYFVTIKDENGAASRQPPRGIISVPVAISGEGLVKGSPLPANEYRLISFPMEMDDQSADEIFLDDLGPYEPSEWRLFEPFVSGNRIQYAEYPEISAFTPGKIALIIVKENRFIDSGSGHSIRTDRPFPVALQPGWNLVGSPFNLPIPSTNLSLKSGQPLLMYGYGDVENSPWQLSDTSAVLPFEGYAVFNRNETADTLFIDPLICTEALDENLCPDKWPAEGQPVINENAAWSVRIAARSNGRKDLENTALAHNDADRRWDALDSPDPPQMGEYISLSFPHEEWGSATANYRVDARPVPDAGDIWTFEVSAGTRENVTLSFDGMESIPGRYRVWLLDEGHAYLQDLRDKAGYSLGTIQINEPVRLNLLVGTDAFIDTLDEHAHPQQFELVQNFPNPFVESTTIRYSIPEGGPVTLEIYDVLGRRLTVLVKASQEVGYHEAAWDGRDQSGIKVASGIYILRLRWKDREKSQMMVRFE